MMKYLLPILSSFVLFACGDAGEMASAGPLETAGIAPTTSTDLVTEFTEEPEDAMSAAGYQNLTPVEFAEQMGEPDAVVLDVRTPKEVAVGKIAGAIELDYRSDDFKKLLLDLEKDKAYLIYCAGGGRSSKTCDMLAEAGYEKLYNLEGGYKAWSGE